jgi:hypothetical protein
MRLVLMATLAAATLSAAAIRGVVLDNQTGRPLARATVVAQPIEGTAGVPRSVRSGPDGAFEVGGLSGGAWLIIGSRRGFAPKQVVAKAADSVTRVAIRLLRFGAITGTVLDENDVGLQEHDVVAYRDVRPLVIAARARTDDRGIYRLEGLEPGAYLVRSVGRDYEEGSYLATFSREVIRLEEARAVTVRYDQEIGHVDVRPFPGRLVSLSGRAYARGPVALTLISDVGVLTATSSQYGEFRFPPVPPGVYELYAQTREAAVWQRVNLWTDLSDHRITPAPHPELRLSIEDTAGKPVDSASVPILIRRRDLAGESRPEPFRGPSRILPPGRWELTLAPTATWYSVEPAGWSEIVVTAPGPVVAKLVLSNRPASLRGVVRDATREPVPGVPVQLDRLRTVRTDIRGQFEFYGLGPGRYRLVAGFDLPVGAEGTLVTLDEGQDRSLDLDLYGAR